MFGFHSSAQHWNSLQPWGLASQPRSSIIALPTLPFDARSVTAAPQNALPGLLTPGRGWAGRVFEVGLRGLYQHLHNLGLEPGEELLAAMQARAR